LHAYLKGQSTKPHKTSFHDVQSKGLTATFRTPAAGKHRRLFCLG
jgi:hypothetical protein